MTVTYIYDNSIYVNLTNRCSNSCDFCVRQVHDGYYDDNLWLDREPTADEAFDSIMSRGPENYTELVFCGYGEPTCRLDVMLDVCRRIKKVCNIPIRINTNGQSDLINERKTAPDFAGAVDTLSVSLNAADAATYNGVCHSVFGESAYPAIIAFATEAAKYVPNVLFSVVRGTIPDADLDICAEIAKKAGVGLRIREMIN